MVKKALYNIHPKYVKMWLISKIITKTDVFWCKKSLHRSLAIEINENSSVDPKLGVFTSAVTLSYQNLS